MRKLMHTIRCFWLLCIALTGCARSPESYLISDTRTPAVSESTSERIPEPGTETAASGFLYVHVCGEVEHPGVYELPAGSRTYEAIQLAGGLTASAAKEAVNQASLLTDGQQIVVPSYEEQASAALTESGTGLVNLNQASAAELMTLPGIGEAKAADIIAYREAQGGFASIEEIKNVSGIKDALFNKIKDKIVV